MPEDDVIARTCDTLAAYLEAGNESFDADGGRFVRNRATPRRYDANHIGRLTAGDDEAIGRLLARADAEFEGYDYRRVDADPTTPPPLVARLVLEGYERTPVVQLLLEGELRAQPRATRIRLVEDDAAWEQYAQLEALDWRETSERQGRPFEPDVLGEFTASKRAKAAAVRYFLAYHDDRAVAYLSSFAGPSGIGMVEDLFTHPEFRHRGIATALIAHCVADARAHGSGAVVIGADPTDTPMRMYAALGFRPLMMTAQYFRRVSAP